jgi:hypothetical protein
MTYMNAIGVTFCIKNPRTIGSILSLHASATTNREDTRPVNDVTSWSVHVSTVGQSTDIPNMQTSPGGATP